MKHTNFECDTRVPLIVRDPRMKTNGRNCSRLVELIDLYPTLCELTGIPVPAHCQGRSFRGLLEDPESGHRIDAYSSYPAHKSLGHSIRIVNHRYTEWRNIESGEITARVLTDLKADPGETVNVVKEPAHAEMLARAAERLELRITEARQEESTPRNRPASAGAVTVTIDPSEANLRQVIDGFGGSIAFWGTRADDEALAAAVDGLDVSIIRVQGEVTRNGQVDHNRDILQRAVKLNPDLQILPTFWQPRSEIQLETDFWLDEVEIDGGSQYVLKPEREDEWADEMVARVKVFRDEWGLPVAAIGVQNESNWSHAGTQTCRWEPERLASFIEEKLKPRLGKSGLGNLKIAAPDLAYIGHQASEVERFLPTLTSPAIDIAAYHMYDSYGEGMDGALETLIANSRKLGQLHREHFPSRKLWMTETTGAQWNSDEWHTYGWTRDLTEHEKAILAGRYIHATLADAGANAFLWWGLVYSLAPDGVTDPDTRQKHRDEGLVLVEEITGQNGRQSFLERTLKSHVFRQYSGFIEPGYQRIGLDEPENLQVSAFRHPQGDEIVVVAINDTEEKRPLSVGLPEEMSVKLAVQTDAELRGQAVDPESALAPKSIRTYVISRTQGD